MRDDRRAVGEPDVEHEAAAIDAEVERVGPAAMTAGPERILLDQIVDRDRALMFHVAAGAADRGLVQRDRDETAGFALVAVVGRHQRLSRMATERAWASSPSALPRTIA